MICLLDAINAIVGFFSAIWDTVLTFVHYSMFLTEFITAVTGFMFKLVSLIPAQFLPIAVITVALSVVLLILGRSNNNG